MNALVVDCDPATQTLLRSWLQESALAVTLADSMDQACRLLDSTSFDIILSPNKPGGDAVEFCRSVRRRPDHARCYFMLYSHGSGALDSAAALDAGVDDLLPNLEEAAFRIRIRAAIRILDLHQTLAEQNATLNNLVGKLNEAFQSIESDLQSASEIQLSLLPTQSEVHPSFSVEWLVLPSSFLSGDNLNYFMMQERYLVFYQLDVAGRGIPSALLSVTLNQLLSPQPGSPTVRFDPKRDVKRIIPPVDVVSELNRRFLPQKNTSFSMIYGVLDTKTRQVVMCQAGHPHPLKVTAEGTVNILGNGGFPVGLWPDMVYEETATILKPQERLVLYSDGLLECVNEDGVPYTLDMFRELLTTHGNASVRDLLHSVQVDLERWGQGRDFPDDISVLIIESR